MATSSPSCSPNRPADSAYQTVELVPTSQPIALSDAPESQPGDPPASQPANVPAPGTAGRYAGIEPHPTLQIGADGQAQRIGAGVALRDGVVVAVRVVVKPRLGIKVLVGQAQVELDAFGPGCRAHMGPPEVFDLCGPQHAPGLISQGQRCVAVVHMDGLDLPTVQPVPAPMLPRPDKVTLAVVQAA